MENQSKKFSKQLKNTVMKLITPDDFKREMVCSLESKMKVPATSYFVKNDNSFRLAYFADKMKYITKFKGESAAEFLKHHRIIDQWDESNGQVLMYRKAIAVGESTNGVPVMFEVFQKVEWNDIELTTHQVLTIAAVHEFELAGMAKIVRFKVA